MPHTHTRAAARVDLRPGSCCSCDLRTQHVLCYVLCTLSLRLMDGGGPPCRAGLLAQWQSQRS
jgi:hypothetical protein